jgi:hypothetical protein
MTSQWPLPVLVAEHQHVALVGDARGVYRDQHHRLLLGTGSYCRSSACRGGANCFSLAIQSTLDEAGIEVRWFEGYGAVVCCPRCGAGVDRLEGWSAVDELRDDTYAGFRCRDCDFNDGGEI